MWICPCCGQEIDRIDHIIFVDGVAVCRESYQEEENED